MVHYVDSLIGIHSIVTWGGFDQVITSMKARCIVVCDLLVTKLKQRFPIHELMNVFGIIYPQYWLQPNHESTFVDHLSIIKRHYYISQKLGVDRRWVSKALSKEILDLQTSLFKLTMKSQASKAMVEPRDENPVTKLWCQLATNNLLVHLLSKFMQLVKLTIVQVISNVEDERTFSTLIFMKSKLHNQFIRHLDIAIYMFAQDIFI
jgi:hypothetical protein